MDNNRYRYSVVKMASRLGISVRSYYDHLSGNYGLREQRKALNQRLVSDCFGNFNQLYGAVRISGELYAQKTPLSRTTVAKYMSQLGLRSRLRRKYRIATTDSNHPNPIAENLLARDFSASAPGQKWVSDITYIRRLGGFEYLTTVIDLFDRKVIGWSFSSDMTDDHTTIAALNMALKRRATHSDGLLFHSDRGVQYTSHAFIKLLRTNNITQSMSRKGNCWDNAVAESFFKTLKSEIIYGATLLSAEKLRNKLFVWIECWYNKNRRHAALNNLTINEFSGKQNTKNNLTNFPNLSCG